MRLHYCKTCGHPIVNNGMCLHKALGMTPDEWKENSVSYKAHNLTALGLLFLAFIFAFIGALYLLAL